VLGESEDQAGNSELAAAIRTGIGINMSAENNFFLRIIIACVSRRWRCGGSTREHST